MESIISNLKHHTLNMKTGEYEERDFTEEELQEWKEKHTVKREVENGNNAEIQVKFDTK